MTGLQKLKWFLRGWLRMRSTRPSDNVREEGEEEEEKASKKKL